ncbi:HET domain protein [Cordyceps fumosorosea ARSEF 2679]|uniref:HET domain protein n=1 Tax=Cordyceps fumosorosea (strain ARSEF 2679) TaxID=1081104 RepID=A0A167LBC6_CORFA|nr:HET domain protein [Cordyceps fumosorosea ARSEF 2679]OAA52881.1 HET domain protein [Cordyceps fumosorosea ARSEF 2679]
MISTASGLACFHKRAPLLGLTSRRDFSRHPYLLRRPKHSRKGEVPLMTSVAAEATTAEGSRRLYEYEPFADARTIRVLTLHPARSPEEPLSGDLSMEPLEEAAAMAAVDEAAEQSETDGDGGFEAVSYVWGSRKRTHELRCGEHRVLLITESIADALRRLRRADDRPRRLWADQVCINQGDVVERSQQVNLMNSVYRSARRVLVWLGRDEEGKARDAIAMVQRLQAVFADEQAHEEFRKAHSENLHQQDAVPWRPFAKLAMLPWFNRIWIVQEIGTRTPATLFWGEAEISWDVLSSVVAVLNERYHHLRARFSVMTPNIRYLHQRFEEPDAALIAANQRHRRGDFVYELHRARHMLAEDPRDRVFAFLGHFSLRRPDTTPALRGLVADYGRSVEDVYCDVAVRGLEGAASLIMLTATNYGAEVSRSRQNSILTNADGSEPSALSFKLNALPSWVPDWRHRAHHLFGTPDTPHRAAGDTKPQLSIDRSTMTLHIKGKHMDTIKLVSWVIRGDSFHVRGQREDATHPMVALWQRVCRQKAPIHLSASSPTSRGYPTGEAPFLALAQCLTNAGVGMSRLREYSTIPTSEHLANAAAYLGRTARRSDPMVSDEIRALGRDGGGDAFKWSHEASLISRYRRLGFSAQGHFVLGPDSMEPGDAVVVLYGGTVPFVLRRRGQRSEDGWVLIGECYVHGMMNGEALTMKGAVDETFSIH